MKWAALFVLVALVLSGCAGSGDGGEATGTEAPSPAAPPPVPESVSSMDFVLQANANATLGFWVDGTTAYLSGPEGLRILDLTDAEAPVLLAENVENTTGTRDVEAFHHPNGRTYAAMSHGGSHVSLTDVTDPRAPSWVVDVPVPTHTVAVVPGTAVVYNSRSISTHVPGAGETGQVDIIDFTDPEHPTVKVFVFPAVVVTVGGTPRPVLSTTCHEMSFNAELKRAYCAGVTDTTIWDTTDPLDPVILQVIDYPLVNIHHSVYDARNGTLLVLGDEFVGVLAPTPMCSDTVPYPTSAVWFFDISDLATPVPVGYYQIQYDAIAASAEAGSPVYCSTHLGDVADGRDLLTLGWYSAGTVLIDFSDPANPFAVDHYRADGPTSTWEARFLGNHVLTGDTVRGMDVLRLA